MKLLKFLTIIICIMTNQSCVTTYSANGYPVQTADTNMTSTSMIGAGIVGFSLGTLLHAPNYAYYESYGGCGFRPIYRGHYSCY